MPAKGAIDPNAAITAQFRLEIPGAPDLVFTRVGEMETQLVMAEMPDKTMQPTGQANPGEFEADLPMHHADQRAFLEAWLILTRTGSPGHKLVGTMYYLRADGVTSVRSVLLDGLVLRGDKDPEMSAGEDGEMAVITYSFTYDDRIKLP